MKKKKPKYQYVNLDGQPITGEWDCMAKFGIKKVKVKTKIKTNEQ